MNHEREFEDLLDQIRQEAPSNEEVTKAAERVRTRLAATSRIESCEDFQALFASYREGSLSPARALLVKDHLRQCVACHRSIEAKPTVVEMPVARRFAAPRWAAAAAVLVAAGAAWWAMGRAGSSESARVTVVDAADGALFRVANGTLAKLSAGEIVEGGAELRAGKDTNAVVRLSDGSTVELGGRAAFAVRAARGGITLDLDRGSIIVQATKRRTGRLMVATRDSLVSVKGTVFSVTGGAKGTRVSVIEGRVVVAQNRVDRELAPGAQFTSSAQVASVPVAEDIAWSRNLDRHIALLRSANALDQRLEAIRFPDLRYASRVLGWLPRETVLVASVPNLERALVEADQVFRQKVQEYPVLADWWKGSRRPGQPSVEELTAKVRLLSQYLGDEVIVAGVPDGRGEPGPALMAAEVKREGLRQFLEGEIAKGAKMRIFDNLAQVSGSGQELLVYLSANTVVCSADAAILKTVVSASQTGAGGFTGTPLHSRLSESYRAGAGILFGADLSKAVAHAGPGAKAAGVADLQMLIAEQKSVAAKTESRAVVAFRGTRPGVFGWLSEPAPIGSLDYVSPEAAAVTSVAFKDPALMLDEAIAWHPNPEATRQVLGLVEARIGINVRNDLAAPLGGDVTFAIDGPVVPTPSWKMALEVYDAPRLQATLEKLVAAYNRDVAPLGRSPLKLTASDASGRTYYLLSMPDAKPISEIHYAYDRGYLVAAPSRALVMRAIEQRAAGNTLARSTKLTGLLPHDHYPNFSGLVYQNIGAQLGGLVETLGQIVPNPEQKQGLAGLGAEMKPVAIAFYGERERIAMAAQGSLLNLGVNNLGVLPLLSGVKGTRNRAAAYR